MRTAILGIFLFAPALFAADERSRGAASPESLMDAGHYKRARTMVASRLRANPNDAYALFLESKIKESFGDLPGSIASAERAVSLEPHNADYHGQLAEAYAYTADESSWVRGIHFVHLMKKEIAAALSTHPNHTDTLLVLMMFSYKAPRLAGGDKKKAQSVAGEIEHNDPRWGYLAEARLLEGSGEDARTESLLKQALRADPTHYRAQYEMARFYCCAAIRKDLAAAERISLDALKLDPSRAGAYDILARVYAAQRKWPELESILAQSEKNVADDLTPYYQAANILVEAGTDLDRAAAYLKKYLGQEPEGREPTRLQAQSLLTTANRATVTSR